MSCRTNLGSRDSNPGWNVLTAPSSREFVKRLVLQKRQRDKGLKGALSLCRVHMSSPSLSLSNVTPVAAQQAGETAGGLFHSLIKTRLYAAACFYSFPPVCQPDRLSWWKTTLELCLWAPGGPHSSCLYCFFHLMRLSTPKTKSLAEKRRWRIRQWHW